MHTAEATTFWLWGSKYDVFGNIFDVMTFMLMSDVEPYASIVQDECKFSATGLSVVIMGYLILALFFRQLYKYTWMYDFPRTRDVQWNKWRALLG